MTAQVTLGPDDVARACRLGKELADRAARNGWTRNVHTTADQTERHIEAAGSELAVSLYTGGEWVDDPNAFRTKPDVMPDLEVRRISKDWWRLPVYRDDHPDRRFVLVSGSMPTYTIVGWIQGYDARRVGEFLDQHNTGVGAWFVPQNALWPAESLRRSANV